MAVILLFVFWRTSSYFSPWVCCHFFWPRVVANSSPQSWDPQSPFDTADAELDDYALMPLTGMLNDGKPGRRTCEELKHHGVVRVQQCKYLDDDLVQVAQTLLHHPIIDYSGQNQSLTFEEMVAKTWARLSGSSVWLEKYQAFLSVTRVIFYDKGVKHWPVISFLTGQLYDADWNELKNYTIKWQGDEITFPTVFNVPAPYNVGEGFFGPEDPRIIIEQDVPNAEPIVVFNMINDLKTYTRAMHLYRPFSNVTTILSITGQKERGQAEKNWAPFFHNENEEGTTAVERKWPSHYVHFIYSFGPLTILRCHALNGWCDIVYEQKIAEEFAGSHDDTHGRISGGTNMFPLDVPASPGVHAYVGFPRSHIDAGCKDSALYRPELMIMTAYKSEFHLNYLSESIDFGDAALPPEGLTDPCGEGRILIPNSIARWDRSARTDILTLSFSVADSTVQVLRLKGLSKYIRQLPYFGSALKNDKSEDGEAIWDLRWSAVGKDVISCSVEAATNYSIAVAAPSRGRAKGKKYDDDDIYWGDEEEKDDTVEIGANSDEKEKDTDAQKEKEKDTGTKKVKEMEMEKDLKGEKDLKKGKEMEMEMEMDTDTDTDDGSSPDDLDSMETT